MRPGAQLMIDANEAWGAKEALIKLEAIRRAGHDLLWVEDPILRHDFDGLRLLRQCAPWTLINSGEYLDAAGKRQLIAAGRHRHPQCPRPGHRRHAHRLARRRTGIPVSLGNTFLEVGVHMAVALPEVEWLEYSFQNFDHLVEQPMEIRDGYRLRARPAGPWAGAVAKPRAAIGRAPKLLDPDELGPAPVNPRIDETARLAASRG